MDSSVYRGLVMHHWDVDGIASAALLLKHIYPGYDNWTPNRGIRRLDPDHIEWLVDYEHVVITDMAIPVQNIKEILESGNVTIIDHHIQPRVEGTVFINPIGLGGKAFDYPSTSWVIKKHFDLPVSLLVVLGLVGDRLQKADENPVIWVQVEEYMERENITREEIFKLSQVLDCLYKIGDIDSVMEAPRLLLDENPDTIRENKGWQIAYKLVESELEKIYQEPVQLENGIIYKELDTKMNIVSDVAKKLAWREGRDTIAVNRGFFDDKDQIYCRSTRIDLTPVMMELQTEGYYATGKPGVLGAVIPAAESDRFIEKMMRLLATQ